VGFDRSVRLGCSSFSGRTTLLNTVTKLPLSSPMTQARDLVLFTSPCHWSLWPVLPVYRPSAAGNGAECGVLFDARNHSGLYGHSATVFLVNLFALPSTVDDLLACPKYVHDTPEELVLDGWTAT
jgi:hypothetical protein